MQAASGSIPVHFGNRSSILINAALELQAKASRGIGRLALVFLNYLLLLLKLRFAAGALADPIAKLKSLANVFELATVAIL